jgi:biopolymer transport protein ExbD
MKVKRANAGREFNVPMSATSDVAFLLLIFIMVLALINYRVEVGIDYAEAEDAPGTSAAKNMEIWIDREGGVYLDGIPAVLAEVEDAVVQMYVDAPDTQIHIIADKNTPYANIAAVLDLLQLLQYRTVSFVVKNAP